MDRVHAVVLAAGKGKRMNSDLPKVLHPLCGRPLIAHVLDMLEGLGVFDPIVVVASGADGVRAAVGGRGRCVEQAQQLGTGHAVMQALPLLAGADGTILVLYGDTPLLRSQTVGDLVEHRQASGAAVAMLSTELENPAGYGRVLRDAAGGVRGIVEETDLSGDESQVREINAGTYAFDPDALRAALAALMPNNAQGEYYLTATIGWLMAAGRAVAALRAPAEQTMGINSRSDLAAAETVVRRRILERLMEEGVTVIDPASTYVHSGIVIGRDTTIHPQTFIEGATSVGRGCVLGPLTRLADATLDDDVSVVASTVTASIVGAGTRIGPYSHLRPGTRVGRYVQIGNYAEMKNSVIGDYTRVHHMSYLGDASVGTRVNIGAGTVTVNYDGKTKHPTTIEDGAFIGSDTMLIAPVRVGRGAMTGAGSVVNHDVPDGAVVVGVPARVIRHVTADR
ncbi:MAG TPA: bifunctional UDP-N-acetylglucosamine diphosphorylase/glucosamine-1-phosphate N-acetyltransferase GlmU [bacterium]